MKIIERITNLINVRVQKVQSEHFEKTKWGRKLRTLRNLHKGERCFIVANGPSLRAEDLNTIRKYNGISFGMNRIYKIFDKTEWRPTYYVCEDINIFHESLEEINAISARKKFIPINHKWFSGIEVKDAYYFWANYDRSKDWENSFSPEIDKWMDSMGTVTFTCMIIAAYMGFSDIYLLGVDHNYHVTIDEDGKTIVDDKAKDYFCENYDKDIKDVVVHNIGNNTKVYRKAKAYCDKHGIRIWNATRGGKLEVYPRVNFDELF